MSVTKRRAGQRTKVLAYGGFMAKHANEFLETDDAYVVRVPIPAGQLMQGKLTRRPGDAKAR